MTKQTHDKRSTLLSVERLTLGACLSMALLLAPGCSQSANPEPSQPSVSEAEPGRAPMFEDVTATSGIDFVHQLADGHLSNIMESDGAGGAILDYDGDGYPDVYLVNSGPDSVISDGLDSKERTANGLYRNQGNGTFENVTISAGVQGHGFGTTAAAADYDNDGDTDLYVVNFGDDILYQNQGDGTFKDVTAAAGIGAGGSGISATWLDIDLDGFLDLFVANYLVFDPSLKAPEGSPQPYPGPLSYPAEFNVLYRNQGDGTFSDVSESAGIRIPNHRAMSVTALDYDRDGDSDIYVSNDGTANLLLQNNGKGQFTDVGLQTGVAVNQYGEVEGSMGAAVGDCTNDGFPDMLVTSFGTASLYINSRAGFFEDRIRASGLYQASAKLVGWGANFIDLDNNGVLDLFIANGDPHFLKGLPCLLMANQGNATFIDITDRGGPFFQRKTNARGSGAVDIDNDGWLDVLITTLAGSPVVLHRQGDGNAHWLTLDLEGSVSNRDGFGCLVEVQTGDAVLYRQSRCPTSYVFQEDPRLHFGLGNATVVDAVRLRWPSGIRQVLEQVAVDQILHVREPVAE